MSFSGYIVCQLHGCNRKHYAKSFCRIHYGRLKRTGNPIKVNYKPWNKGIGVICRIKKCNNQSKALSLCNKHYLRMRRMGVCSFWNIHKEDLGK